LVVDEHEGSDYEKEAGWKIGNWGMNATGPPSDLIL